MMKLQDFATDLTAGNRFVKAAFGGFAGAGKSVTATEFVIGAYRDLGYEKPVLILDNEKGSRFLIPRFKRANIQAVLKETTSLADVLSAFDFLGSGEVSVLLIDSLTKVWYRYVREYMQVNRRTFMELADWGKLLPKWQEVFSDAFVQAPGSIIFTGRGGFTYEKEEDTRDERTGAVKKGSFVKSGVKMKLAGETPFEPDLNVWMEQQQEIGADGALRVWREAHVMKDRASIIDGAVFVNPTYENFRPFVRYLLEVPVGEVAGESLPARDLAPSENYESFDRRRKREICLEEIAEELAHLHPGSADAAKSARKELLEVLFETRSWKAVEAKSLDELLKGRNALWLRSRGHAYGADPTTPAAADEHLNGDAQLPFEAPAAAPLGAGT